MKSFAICLDVKPHNVRSPSALWKYSHLASVMLFPFWIQFLTMEINDILKAIV